MPSKKSTERIIVAAVSDYQCGFRFGMLPPGTMLDPWGDIEEEWEPKLTAVQKMIWGWAEDGRKQTADLAGDDEIVLLHIGDVCHGDHSDHLITDRMSDQYKIAQEAMKYWLDMPNVKAARIVKGSRWHSMAGGSAELTVARGLRGETGKDVKAWHHMLLKIRGVEFDIAHKRAAPGKRPWTDDSEFRWYIKALMLNSLKSGTKPPDVVLGGHYHDRIIVHQHIHTWAGTTDTWGAVVPASSIMLDDYTQAATRSKDHMTSGLLSFEIIDGRLKEVYDFTHSLDIRKLETIR